MSISVAIHEAAASDASRIQQFVKLTLKSLYKEGEYNPDPEDLANLEKNYLLPQNACFIIAEGSSGELIGTAAVRPYNGRFPFLEGRLPDGNLCEMVRYYIDPRSRRQGVGAALYSRAEAFARRAGYEGSYLHTSVYLPGGYPFWTSRGYSEQYWETDQIVHMYKKLRDEW